MPGSPVLSLLSFVASHLVLMVFAGFLVVGLHLAGLLGDGLPVFERPRETFVEPQEMEKPQSLVARPSEVSTQTAPEAAGRFRESSEPRSSTPSDSRQPVMIGGALPNYAGRSDRQFRPPRGGSPAAPVAPDREELVQQARRAFWNGDVEKAEATYMRLLTRFPDDGDAFGELGNLYHSIGNDQQALDAYFEAGLRLRATGQREKLTEVIDLLESEGYTDIDRLRP